MLMLVDPIPSQQQQGRGMGNWRPIIENEIESSCPFLYCYPLFPLYFIPSSAPFDYLNLGIYLLYMLLFYISQRKKKRCWPFTAFHRSLSSTSTQQPTASFGVTPSNNKIVWKSESCCMYAALRTRAFKNHPRVTSTSHPSQVTWDFRPEPEPPTPPYELRIEQEKQ